MKDSDRAIYYQMEGKYYVSIFWVDTAPMVLYAVSIMSPRDLPDKYTT